LITSHWEYDMTRTCIYYLQGYRLIGKKRFNGLGRLSAIAAAIILPSAAIAQVDSPVVADSKPRFSVAEVKPCDPKTPRGTFRGTITNTSVMFTCQPLDRYIWQAFGLEANDKALPDPGASILPGLEGGPQWIRDERYEIVAKTEQPVGSGVLAGSMMRTLLEEQFHVKLHREPRQVDVYELVVAKSGLRLPPAKIGCLMPQEMPVSPDPGSPMPPGCFAARLGDDGFTLLGSTMANFCYLINYRLPPRIMRNIKLVDKTGVAGQFDFNLPFSFAPEASATPGSNLSLEGPYFDSMQSALNRVGLQMVLGKGTSDALVLDQVKRPRPN
jgi:uncharacterized protein (TIGR03435 family)